MHDVNSFNVKAIFSSKLLETVIANQVFSTAESEKYQFGFKANHSTGICTHLLKQTVEYYMNRSSHVFACFVDLTVVYIV